MILELAGVLGVYWGDWTLRELVQAWEGRMKAEWGIASSHLSMLANAHRDPKRTRAFKPDDFNPFAEKQSPATRIPLTSDNVELLRAFVRK